MPTHPQPIPRPVDPLDEPIWGARAIGEVIGRSEKSTYWLLDKGVLPATRVGKAWVSTRRRLRAAIGVSAPQDAA
jgi:hypothetical protein